MTTLRWIHTLLLATGLVGTLGAGPADPEPKTVRQPDGTRLTLQAHGDEVQNWIELGGTGYTLLHNPASGAWDYAERDEDGGLRPSGVQAFPGAINVPPHIPRFLKPPRHREAEASLQGLVQESLRERTAQTGPGLPGALRMAGWEPVPVSGARNLLVILINYANRTLQTPTAGWYSRTFDAAGQSVVKFYQDNSLGALTLQPVAHTQPGNPAGILTVTLADNHPNYGSSYTFTQDQTIGNHALQQAAPYVNFDSFDTNGDGRLDTSELVIYFVHAGYEASGSASTPNVWAHAWWTAGTGLTAGTKNVQRWALNGELYDATTPLGIGTMCHELGHQFCGFPDLYDTAGVNGAMGYFSLMASGSWGADSSVGEAPSHRPTLLDAWSRQYVGWAAPTLPAAGTLTFTLPLTGPGASFKLLKPALSTTEYFLAELRHPTGWDRGMIRSSFFGTSWEGGLLIQHIDTLIGTPGSNNINRSGVGAHQGVLPVQASTAACDMILGTCRGHRTTLFYAGNNAAWTDTTTPNSRYYSGASTMFSLTEISGPGTSMTALFSPDPTATITLSPASLPGGSTGVAYSQTITASGGTAPYTYLVSAGTLPAGLALSGAGVLSGTPTTVGTATFTVQATDSHGTTGTRGYTLTVTTPTLTLGPAGLPGGTTGAAYSQTITASGGTAPYTYLVSAGTLPAGLALSDAGVLAGTPTTPGTATFTVQATDSHGITGTRGYTLTVTTPTLTLEPTGLPDGTTYTAYTQTITASGGTAPYTYLVSAGTLPTGLALSSAGVLSGTPTAAGGATFTVQATDSHGLTGTRAYTLTIANPTVTVNPPSLPGGTVGVAYSQTLTASGGTAPYTYLVSAGTLPAGLALSGAGVLSGIPTATGTATFSIQAADSHGATGTRAYTLTVGITTLALDPPSLPGGSTGSAYSQTITASGGTAPYTYLVSAGTLPAGLALSGAGVLSGIPSVAGTFTFTIQATDHQGATGTRGYTLTVSAPTLTLNPASLPGGSAGVAYSQMITASGGTAPYTFTVSAGTLPTGLALSGAGVLSGTPSAAGTFTFTVQATDQHGATGTRGYTLTIGQTPTVAITLSPTTATMLTGAARTFQADVTGTANTAVTWTFTGGSVNSATANPVTFTAPAAAGTYLLTATSSADPAKSATATVTVNAMKSRDLNSDSVVDVRDMAHMARAYGKLSTDPNWATYAPADLNWDDKVDDDDITLLLAGL